MDTAPVSLATAAEIEEAEARSWGDLYAAAPADLAIVADGLIAGARRFIADIEAPSEAMDTLAYGHFGRLSFNRPYVRTHWASVGEKSQTRHVSPLTNRSA